MKHVSLTDRYDLSQSRIFVNGAQAVTRLALMQHARDVAAGLDTAGYITGYRGSPLGGLDLQLQMAGEVLNKHSIIFQPGVNEDLAATALWGSQMAELRGKGKHDGVFGIWYGKGPGVDRSGDAFRHANHAGTSKHGGVIALMGDDHTCESSTSAHQSEFAFVDAMMPVLNPAGLQEIIDYGLYGWALSRFAGVWSGIKCVKDNIEQTASIDASLDRVKIILPEEFEMPAGGLNIRLGDAALAKEERLHRFKRPAMLAFARANKIDRIILEGGGAPRLGIVAAGKSYLDVMEALNLLGIFGVRAAKLGVKVYKPAMVWPLEPEGVARFASNLETIMVVEEKRSLIETQLKEQLYGKRSAPVILGKQDEQGMQLFAAYGALEPTQIARAIAANILARQDDEELRARLERLDEISKRAIDLPGIIERVPYFCAGCPHNTSTVVPDGAHAYAGIGCHYMAQWMDRSTEGFTHMGAEGANWIGEAPFSKEEHVFQNIGDGTYVHSGALAIRAAIAAGVTMTYKILFNDAVAMTGGQGLDGGLTVPQLAHQMSTDGASRVVIVSADPARYKSGTMFPAGTSVHHRDELDAVQRDLQQIKGVSVLIYDQTCAAELRRRRRRGKAEEPPERVVINELVCEGCGDCGVQSNCVAIVPVETEHGRKRAIDQTACNKDYSCLKGFCPSFVTVTGATLKGKGEEAQKQLPAMPDLARLKEPAVPDLDDPYSMVITGVGGTGVVTIGALVGMAAHIEEKGVAIIDMSGLAQKGGAVAVHLRVAKKPDDIKAIRASAVGADLVLGCDLVVAASNPVLGVISEGVTTVIANDHEMMVGEFTRKPDLDMPVDDMREALVRYAGKDKTRFINAHNMAMALLGDTMSANVFMLGFAAQAGIVPVSINALEEAIRLNGVAVERNLDAFRWGRIAADDPRVLDNVLNAVTPMPARPPKALTLDEVIERREKFLTRYQNAAYAKRYRARVDAIRKLELERMPSSTALTKAVAQGLFKLMAYKDEYEVARLFTDGSFKEQLAKQFSGDVKLEYHLAPPLLARVDAISGRPAKKRYGPWIEHAFRVLAKAKVLRGTFLDPFGYGEDRRLERKLLREYETMLGEITGKLSAQNHAIAVDLAAQPETIRGYGPVKKVSAEEADARREALLEALTTHAPGQADAA